MSVKFIRTCNRCGKVLEDIKGDDKNTVNYHGHNNRYFTVTSNEHPEFSLQEYDLCEDCHKDFVKFMEGKTVLDISLRGKYVDTDNAKKAMNEKFGNPDLNEDGPIYKYIKQIERVERPDGSAKLGVHMEKVEKNDENGWSPEVLELARKHNDNVLGKVTEVVKHDDGVDIKATLKDKSAIQLKPGTHTYHRWTKEEDQFIAFHSAGMTMNELANKFGVTLKAVQLRKSMILNGKVHVEKEEN